MRSEGTPRAPAGTRHSSLLRGGRGRFCCLSWLHTSGLGQPVAQGAGGSTVPSLPRAEVRAGFWPGGSVLSSRRPVWPLLLGGLRVPEGKGDGAPSGCSITPAHRVSEAGHSQCCPQRGWAVSAGDTAVPCHQGDRCHMIPQGSPRLSPFPFQPTEGLPAAPPQWPVTSKSITPARGCPQ